MSVAAFDRSHTRSSDALAGTRKLTWLLLRRDRLRIALWVLGLGFASVLTGTSFAGLYVTDAERDAIASALESPAMVAMSGVNHGRADYHVGAMLAHQMFWFTLVLTGLMAIFLAIRATRLEEATGRAELVRAAAVGRAAGLTAGMVVVAVATSAVGLVTAVTLGASGLDGVDWRGSALYGVSHALIGLVFGGIAMVTAQLTEHPRGATGLAVAALAASSVVRAIGDLTGTGVSWLSPIGWAQATQVFVTDRWWPLLPAVMAIVAATAVAGLLSARRDVGAGLRRPRPGPAVATTRLLSPWGLAVRLQRASALAWVVGLALLGATYGSVLGETERMISSIDALGDFLDTSGGIDVMVAFASTITAVMAIIASIGAVQAVLRLRGEEMAGRADVVLAAAVSRPRWFASHVVVAAVLGAFAVLAAALGLGAVGAATTGQRALLGDAVTAAVAYIPALWVTLAIAAALVGWAPRLAHAGWLVVVASFVDVYLGGLLQLPAWTSWTSPFALVPQIPIEAFSLTTVVAMVGAAFLIVVVGVVGVTRRDLAGTSGTA